MRWVAPTEKDTANEVLEKRLWAAADQFRANSGLRAGQKRVEEKGHVMKYKKLIIQDRTLHPSETRFQMLHLFCTFHC